MNSYKPSTASGKRLLLAAFLVASTPVVATLHADGPAPRRLPAVATSTAPHGGSTAPQSGSTAPQSGWSTQHKAAIPPTVGGLFASFPESHTPPTATLVAPVAATVATKPVAKAVDLEPQRWLRSSTSAASAEVAQRLIAQASQEYAVGAWASAETSAWEALRWAAEGVELAEREAGRSTDQRSPALANLQIARTAIREARDFGGHYGVVDTQAIRRMVASHRTTVLDSQPIENLTSTDVIDRYLDSARVRLSGIAAQSAPAAQAMDLLAAIYLGRADSRTLPSSTALCLRRAALQGQPANASLSMRLGMHLADLGLYEEARWALQHSLKLQPSKQASDALVSVLRRSGQNDEAASLIAAMENESLARQLTIGPRVPDVALISPEEFASISKPVNKSDNKGNALTGTLASAKKNLVQVVSKTPGESDSDEDATSESKKPSLVRRFFKSFIPVW